MRNQRGPVLAAWLLAVEPGGAGCPHDTELPLGPRISPSSWWIHANHALEIVRAHMNEILKKINPKMINHKIVRNLARP